MPSPHASLEKAFGMSLRRGNSQATAHATSKRRSTISLWPGMPRVGQFCNLEARMAMKLKKETDPKKYVVLGVLILVFFFLIT